MFGAVNGAESQGLRFCSIVLLIKIFLFVACAERHNSEGIFVPVAEFEDQESTLICWDPQHQDIILGLIEYITTKDHVTLFYNLQNHEEENIQKLLARKGIKKKTVSLMPFKLQKDNIWIRDYSPVFMVGEDGEEEILSFTYPHEEHQEYNLFGEQYAPKLRLQLKRSRLYSSGGGREINGKGTMILVEAYEKAINPGLSLEEIENEYKQKLLQKHIIWLKRGIPQDDEFDNGPVVGNIFGNGVNGHIDEFCRFADAQTILLSQVDSADMQRDAFYISINERLEESYEILRQAKDQDGRPFNIIRVPQAPVIFNQGQYNGAPIYYTPVTSYMNFVLTNNTVVVPSYYSVGDPDFIKEKEVQVRKIFQEVFKSRRVFMLNSINLNYYGGGLHCITSHKPKNTKRRSYKYKGIFGKLG